MHAPQSVVELSTKTLVGGLVCGVSLWQSQEDIIGPKSDQADRAIFRFSPSRDSMFNYDKESYVISVCDLSLSLSICPSLSSPRSPSFLRISDSYQLTHIHAKSALNKLVMASARGRTIQWCTSKTKQLSSSTFLWLPWWTNRHPFHKFMAVFLINKTENWTESWTHLD